MRGLAIAIGTLLLALLGTPAAAKPAFSDWAAVVVAGDWHAHSGGPTEAFDNARRDVSTQLEQMGFGHDNIRQFSVRPERYTDTRPGKTELNGLYEGLKTLSGKATAGCLLYFTSHGAPQGILFDQNLLPPGILNQVVDNACPGRPTIVIISACFSGVFIPTLARSDRMILTAARPDRTSFGCSESDKYPFFDDCFLKTAPKAKNFQALGKAVQQCVADKETETGMSPPSEPQMWIGPQLAPMLPLMSFSSS